MIFDVVKMGVVVRQCGGALLDVRGDLGQGRAAVGAGEFQAIVFGRVVAGGDVDAAIQFIVNDGMSQRGSRRWFRAENDPQPFFRSTLAAVRANSGEKKRVSWPTTTLGFFFCAQTCPAMAAEARRTPAKVKSSAMTPRQPEVPKWIVCFVTGDYCIVARERKSRKNGASRKSKGGRAVKDDG